jgi:hypothetical protein
MYSRIVEPYVQGVDGQGRALLVAWQVSGGSYSGITSGWKHFRIAEIVGLSLMDEKFKAVRLLSPSALSNVTIF